MHQRINTQELAAKLALNAAYLCIRAQRRYHNASPRLPFDSSCKGILATAAHICKHVLPMFRN